MSLDSKIHSQRTGSKSQPWATSSSSGIGWIPKYILKELEANHNALVDRLQDLFAGFQNTFSKNWKQITTRREISLRIVWLDSKIHSQRTGSKSQHSRNHYTANNGWIPKYILKELEANHNTGIRWLFTNLAGFQNTFSKNWKQITTDHKLRPIYNMLDSKIHSQRTGSKSQRFQYTGQPFFCWIPKYILKELEANHNVKRLGSWNAAAGFQNTFSKNWKQITTFQIVNVCEILLDSKIHSQRTGSKSQQ